MKNLVIKNKGSIWLMLVVLIISAIMMQPNFASLIAVVLEGIVLVLMRWTAFIEAKGV